MFHRFGVIFQRNKNDFLHPQNDKTQNPFSNHTINEQQGL
jgi:hypothetical protein